MSGMSTLTVNWNKNTYTVPFSAAAGVAAVKQSIQDQTGVPIDRQKIMPKTKKTWKGILKVSARRSPRVRPRRVCTHAHPACLPACANQDDFDLSSLPATVECLLMGSAETHLIPQTKTVFLEDLKEEDVAKAGAELPAGLVNLGNTCYMNSTLQCLRYTEDWRKGLSAGKSSSQFTSSLDSAFEQLDSSIAPVPPVGFWSTLKQQ